MKTLQTALLETIKKYPQEQLVDFVELMMGHMQSDQLLRVAQVTFIENDPLISIDLEDRTVDVHKLSLTEIIKSNDPVDIYGKIVLFGYPSDKVAQLEWTGMTYQDMHTFKAKVNSLLAGQ